MAETHTILSPDFTEVVNQEFFIEALEGSKSPYNLLDNFPETIYTHSPDSNLVALLYALLGPAGVGDIRKNYLLARLDFEEYGLNTTNLDALYGNIFAFARFASETYTYIPTELLTAEQWSKIQSADSSYRNRAVNYLKAARAGGTLLGIEAAATSGLNRPVDVIENYRFLYDQFSDSPLGLERYGVTQSPEEVIILPRQDVPKSSVQIITFSGTATTGSWHILFPLGSEEITIPFEAHFTEIQTLLENLPVIGKGNVVVSGGPATANPITISFTRELADKALPDLIVHTGPLVRTSSDGGLFDLEGHFVSASLETVQAGTEADGEDALIAPEDWYYASLAIDKIKPMTTILTPGSAPGSTKRQIPNFVHADSTKTQVIRYVTGLNEVKWPKVDGLHWIVAGREKEAPLTQYAQRQHYVNFHNILAASAYTDEGLRDPRYISEQWTEALPIYDSEQIGEFSSTEKALFPIFHQNQNASLRYEAKFALAEPPNPLTIQAVAQGESLIEGIYPTDYRGLTGISKPSTSGYFWSSLARSGGTEYLEIDLGKVQAVNYLMFEAINKPLDLEVSYDILDMAPLRSFLTVMIQNDQTLASTASLGYDASASNPWKTVEIHFSNSLNEMIFTRFLRIAFKRRSGEPYVLANGSPVAFSVQVQNLRIGRNLS